MCFTDSLTISFITPLIFSTEWTYDWDFFIKLRFFTRYWTYTEKAGNVKRNERRDKTEILIIYENKNILQKLACTHNMYKRMSMSSIFTYYKHNTIRCCVDNLGNTRSASHFLILYKRFFVVFRIIWITPRRVRSQKIKVCSCCASGIMLSWLST